MKYLFYYLLVIVCTAAAENQALEISYFPPAVYKNELCTFVLLGEPGSQVVVERGKNSQTHNFVKNSLSLPYSAKEDIKYLEKVKVLFIHSKTDKVVPFHHYQTVKQNCKAQNQSLIYEGKHIAYPVLFPQKYVEAVNKLLKK